MVSQRKDERLVLLFAAVLSLAILFSPRLPAIDYPQHLALATQLGRIWQGDPEALATYQTNLASHNAGMHVVVALLGYVMPVAVAGRLFLAAYPPLFLYAILLVLRALDLPAWRALLLVPVTLGFSFAWGFANFCMGTALGFVCIALVLRQFRDLRLARAAWLALLALLLGVTHVMAMLLVAAVCFVSGIEFLFRYERKPRTLITLVFSGAPLLAGCLFDLYVYFRHVAIDAASYTTQPGSPETSLLKKLSLFGASASPMFGTLTDTAIAWMLTALLLAMIVIAVRSHLAREDRSGTEHSSQPLALPAALMLLGYFTVPHVFLNTHLIYQRLALWTLACAVFALPPLVHESVFRRAALFFASLSALLVPLHFAWFSWETRGLETVLAAIPPGARVVADMESSRTVSVRMASLTHASAMAVPRGAADDGFSFARWLGMPVRYRPEAFVPYPSPSFEHGNSPYDPMTPFARRFPWLVVRTAWENEPNALLMTRLFGAHQTEIQLVVRDGSWALFDTRGVHLD